MAVDRPANRRDVSPPVPIPAQETPETAPTTPTRLTRADVRRGAWLRSHGRCLWPTCRRVLMLETDNEFALAHGHELKRRGQGGDPCDPHNVVCLCARCHLGLHPRIGGKVKRIVGTDACGLLECYERTGPTWTMVGVVGGVHEDQ
jgi:hypothetical protein